MGYKVPPILSRIIVIRYKASPMRGGARPSFWPLRWIMVPTRNRSVCTVRTERNKSMIGNKVPPIPRASLPLVRIYKYNCDQVQGLSYMRSCRTLVLTIALRWIVAMHAISVLWLELKPCFLCYSLPSLLSVPVLSSPLQYLHLIVDLHGRTEDTVSQGQEGARWVIHVRACTRTGRDTTHH